MKTAKKMITASFIELLDDRHFDDVTVIDIVRRAAVSRSTFYLHFTDKFQLMEELRKSANDQLLSFYTVSVEANSVTEQICRHIFTYRSFYKWEFSDATAIHLLSNQLTACLYKVYNDRDYAIFASYGTIGYLSTWVTEGFKTGPAEAAEKLVKIGFTDWTENLLHQSN